MSAPRGETRPLVRVGRVEDVPLFEGRSVAVAGRRVAVFRLPDGFYACDNACPHAGGPLADGLVGDGCVTCPLHNWRIDLRSGRVVAGGEGCVRTYRVRERDGELWLELDAGGGSASADREQAAASEQTGAQPGARASRVGEAGAPEHASDAPAIA